MAIAEQKHEHAKYVQKLHDEAQAKKRQFNELSAKVLGEDFNPDDSYDVVADTLRKKEIEYATRVLLARDEAFKKGLGVFSLDGKMVDKPVIERAEKVIEKAKRFGVL